MTDEVAIIELKY